MGSCLLGGKLGRVLRDKPVKILNNLSAKRDCSLKTAEEVRLGTRWHETIRQDRNLYDRVRKLQHRILSGKNTVVSVETPPTCRTASRFSAQKGGEDATRVKNLLSSAAFYQIRR